MVILNVFNSLDFGGIESRAYMIHSSSVGHAFVAISKGGAVQERIAKEGGKVFVLNVDSKIPSFSAVRSLYHLFKTVKPDVVHCRGAEANFHGLLAAWAAGVPVRIVEEIGIPTHGRLGKALFRLVYMFSHRVVAISDAVQNWLVDNREVLRSKTVRIYNPVQVERHDNKNRVAPCDSVFRICFVGRLEEVKNPTSLIRAVSLLRNENIPVELVIVGDGSQREECVSLCSELGVGDVVSLVGYSSAPLNYVTQCDLYVQPSLSEGFGIALVEAMLCGVPVLATAVGGAPEIIRDGHNGWLTEACDPASLADAIIKIWKNRAELPVVGEAAYKSVNGRFDISKYITELDALYNEVSSVRRN